jgi:hypothetical protein
MRLANQRLPRVTPPPHRGSYIIIKHYLMILLLLPSFGNTTLLGFFLKFTTNLFSINAGLQERFVFPPGQGSLDLPLYS